jgi:RNA polymerase-binding transcription factor DksA
MTEYKLQLEALRENLTAELQAVGIHDPHNPADWIAVPEGVDANQSDTDLLADVVEEWDGRAALVATLERQWNDITRALGKIEDGTFGNCEICSAPIEGDRLAANPSARTCKAHLDNEGELTE